jgi:hypothetical protein
MAHGGDERSTGRKKLPAGAVGIQDLRWRDLNIEI